MLYFSFLPSTVVIFQETRSSSKKLHPFWQDARSVGEQATKCSKPASYQFYLENAFKDSEK